MPELPQGWTLKLFGDIARYATGRTPARNNLAYWDTQSAEIPWVSISDMDNYRSLSETTEKITTLAFEEVFRGRISPANTLLMSFKLTIGRVSTLRMAACHNEAIISIYPREGVNQKYLEYYLSSVDYSVFQDRQIKGDTLNQEKIHRIPILLPPINCQERIADVLNKVRKSMEVEEHLYNAARMLKKSAMYMLFSQGLHEKSHRETEIGTIPEKWNLETLGQHHLIVSGGTPSRSNPAFWRNGSIPWVKTTEVDYCVIDSTEEKITQEGLENSSAKLLPPGILLMAMYGQGVTRGKVALLGIEAACNQACAAIHSVDDSIDTRYLYHFLTYRYEAIRQLAHGGQQQNLNLEIVRDLPIAFPNRETGEQQEIVAILDAIDQKIDLHKRKREILEKLFNTLLHQLMTGQLRVDDLDLNALQKEQPELVGEGR